MLSANDILFRHTGRFLCVPDSSVELPLTVITAWIRNYEGLGYVPSETLIAAFKTLSIAEAQKFHTETLQILARTRGVTNYKPFYPNFPKETQTLSDAELYLNATLHYLTVGLTDIGINLPIWELKYSASKRPSLRDTVKLTVIDLATEQDLGAVCKNIVTANTSMTPQWREDLKWFITNGTLELTEKIPNRENLATVAAMLIQHSPDAIVSTLKPHVKTATDVLRVAVALSGGDVSLAKPTKFVKITRPQRRALLQLVELVADNRIDEDLRKWQGPWLRLSERLHSREYASRFPKASQAIQRLRENTLQPSLMSKVKTAFPVDLAKTLDLLKTTPGEFTRQLDWLLCNLTFSYRPSVITAWKTVVDKVSTPVLLQIIAHFQSRSVAKSQRIFFPKGNLNKAHVEPDTRPVLPLVICEQIVEIARTALIDRFRSLPALGKCWVGTELLNYPVPHSGRNSTANLRQLVRGSRVQLDTTKPINRFFIHWRNSQDRVDLDLSSQVYDDNWNLVSEASYFNLRDSRHGIYHSGDITTAPKGAAEYIDVDSAAVRARGGRYILMLVNSFTNQRFCDIPEISAGWQQRESDSSGEIFEPRTVVDRFEVSSDATMAVPLIIDVVDNCVLWMDLSVKNSNLVANNVRNNATNIRTVCQGIVEMNKPSLWELFSLHAQARGALVQDPTQADVKFGVEGDITPQDSAKIASEFLT